MTLTRFTDTMTDLGNPQQLSVDYQHNYKCGFPVIVMTLGWGSGHVKITFEQLNE